MSFRPGDPVLLRSLYRGRVRWTFPHTFVDEHAAGRIAFLIRPGARGKLIRRDGAGRYLERWIADDEPDDHTWATNRILWLWSPGDAFCVGVFWNDATDELRGWYIQLCDPLRRSRVGFDTMDHALDIWIPAAGSPEWKDEHDFAEAQELGVFTSDQAAAVRAEGERALEARPWPTGWEEWRPDPAWPLPELPMDWHVVP